MNRHFTAHVLSSATLVATALAGMVVRPQASFTCVSVGFDVNAQGVINDGTPNVRITRLCV